VVITDIIITDLVILKATLTATLQPGWRRLSDVPATHWSAREWRIEKCRRFFDHLWRRGYPAAAICSTFQKVSWSQRQQGLNLKMKSKNEIFFATYLECGFSSRNAQGSYQLKETLDISLKALQEDLEGGEIFPARGFFAAKTGFPMGYALQK
jgi:hypothetical protein